VTSSVKRSLVRVKIWSLWGVFLSCWLGVRFGNWPEGAKSAMVAVACITAILFYAIRCERCGTAEFTFGFRSGPQGFQSLFRPPKFCKKCGIERV
jgi:hypothetical protein